MATIKNKAFSICMPFTVLNLFPQQKQGETFSNVTYKEMISLDKAGQLKDENGNLIFGQ